MNHQPQSDPSTGQETAGERRSLAAHSFSVPRRLLVMALSYLPLLHVAGVVCVAIWPWAAMPWRLTAALALLYLLPPLVARLIVRGFPFRSAVIQVGSADFFKWWALLNLQVLFCRLPALEEAMRIVPAAHSAWLRLWGSRIGRLVYWAPGTRILDRSFLDIGDDKALFGASVHPFRRDALAELDRVVALGACLIKWIPSAQNIAPDDPQCLPFYDRMAQHGIPLLSHTGIEHTLPMFDDALNATRRLTPALDRGVTVIAAHCGARLFLHERCHFDEWARLAREHPRLYGDVSAFGLPVHGRPLRRILKDPALLAKVVYGSDFPASAMPLWYAHRLGLRQALRLRAVPNPFDRVFLTMRAMGLPDQVFSRAGELLRTNEAPLQAEGHAGPPLVGVPFTDGLRRAKARQEA
jgi:hypothetical protein